MEDFNRPNHPDFATSSELKQKEWTGLRQNQLISHWEFWVLGEVRKTVSFEAATLNPDALGDAHREVFKQF